MAQQKKVAQAVAEEDPRASAASQAEPEQEMPAEGANAAAEVEQPEPVLTLEEQLATAVAEVEDYKDKFLRARADLENYRKRSVQFIADGVRESQAQAFQAILPVVDNLERAVAYQEQHQADSVEDLLTGVRMTLLQLRDILERQDVKRIAALGEPFDPRFHEAVEVQAVAEDIAADTVVGEIQSGYLFGDAVLRPARVRVAQQRHVEQESVDSA